MAWHHRTSNETCKKKLTGREIQRNDETNGKNYRENRRNPLYHHVFQLPLHRFVTLALVCL
eukprot:m.274227 g.274227  ORF g.274227 m.274227 type:complete len:61 (+) comp111295_c0_seq1:118-300(+)